MRREASWLMSVLAFGDGDTVDFIALTNGVNHFLAIARNLTEYSVLAVEPRGCLVGDEELRAVGVGASIGHAQHARAAVG